MLALARERATGLGMAVLTEAEAAAAAAGGKAGVVGVAAGAGAVGAVGAVAEAAAGAGEALEAGGGDGGEVATAPVLAPAPAVAPVRRCRLTLSSPS